jgi:hypothetical protein
VTNIAPQIALTFVTEPTVRDVTPRTLRTQRERAHVLTLGAAWEALARHQSKETASVGEVADRLAISRTLAYKLAREGRLPVPVIRLGWVTALTRAAGFLRDLPAAWATATPEQRNDVARLIFQRIEVKDDQVVAVVPQPDFAPFFVERHQRENGGHGNTPEGSGGVNREIEEAEATGVGLAHTSCAGWHGRHRHGSGASSGWDIQARKLSTSSFAQTLDRGAGSSAVGGQQWEFSPQPSWSVWRVSRDHSCCPTRSAL